MAVAALPGPPIAAAAAQPSSDQNPIAITLGSIRPLAPQPGDTLVVTGTLTNTSAQPISDLGVQLEMGASALIARGTFDIYAADPTGDLDGSGLQAATSVLALHDPTLDAEQSEPFSISVPIDQLNLPDVWQVRELGIAASGATEFSEGVVGQVRTFLPYAPANASIGRDRLDVAWLWPLVDRPHRAVTAEWMDDDLAPELAPGGRLATLVDAAANAASQSPGGRHTQIKDVPVTWAIDPMLLDDVNAMRSGYKVASAKGPVAGTGTKAAQSWLASLRSATAQATVVALPYGDPDIAAEVRSGLTTLLGLASRAGHSVITRLLPTATALDTDWPPGGMLDERSADALIADGVTSVVLSDQALPPTAGELSETPSAHASLSTDAGTIDAALSDSTLSGAVNSGANSGADSALVTQRVMAETLMIEAEAPSDQRDILISPTRRWDPSPTFAAALLADSGRVPWIQPVTLSQVLQSPVYTKVERSPLNYPASSRQDELPASYMGQVNQVQQKVSELTSILPAGNTQTFPYGTALLRAVSSAWRSEPTLRDEQLAAIDSAVKAAMSEVHIASKAGSYITLTSHGGQFPVTIVNNLNAPVNVTVELEKNPRLTFAHGGREQRTIPAQQALAVDFGATAKTSGVFPIQVQLLTPDGHEYGTPVQLFVRSTVYGTITLVITGAATAALLIAVGVRLTRRAIASRRATAAAS